MAVIIAARQQRAAVISFVTQGTTPSVTGVGTGLGGTAQLNPDTPAHNIGDLLFVFVATKPDTAALTVQAGYTLVPNSETSGGGGTTGADTGPSRIASWYRVADGTASDTLPAWSLTASAPGVGQIFVYRSDAGAKTVWDLAGTAGTDATIGTDWSITGAADPGIQGGDRVVVGNSIPTDFGAAARWSAQAITSTGITYGTMTERSEPATSRGNDLGGMVCDFVVTSGVSSAVPVFTATASTATNQNGCGSIARIRAYGPHTTFGWQAVDRLSRW